MCERETPLSKLDKITSYMWWDHSQLHKMDMAWGIARHANSLSHRACSWRHRRSHRNPLYEGCTTFTRLTAVLALANLKARFGWNDKSFNELLVLLKKMLPENNTLPKNQYEAKKILCPVGMEYQKIHSFPYDCILYRNQFAELRKCPTCGVSRYKVKDADCINDATTNSRPAKVCWYLPIIPRFKRLFANQNDAKNLR